MDIDSAVKEMKSVPDGDAEYAHSKADDILIDFLKANGYGDLAKAWEELSERAGFWYA